MACSQCTEICSHAPSIQNDAYNIASNVEVIGSFLSAGGVLMSLFAMFNTHEFTDRLRSLFSGKDPVMCYFNCFFVQATN